MLISTPQKLYSEGENFIAFSNKGVTHPYALTFQANKDDKGGEIYAASLMGWNWRLKWRLLRLKAIFHRSSSLFGLKKSKFYLGNLCVWSNQEDVCRLYVEKNKAATIFHVTASLSRSPSWT